MAKALVSAIIPTYNRADLICEAVDSVLGQTYPHVEVIVVDDGSTDNTMETLARYGNKIRVIRQTNAGPSAARNRGIKAANGEIVAFLDSDDLWLPTKLQRQANILMRADKSVPCCLCNATMRYTNGDEKRSFALALLNPQYAEGLWLNVAQMLSTRFIFFNQAVAIRREAIDKVGLFDESLLLLEDYDMALRMAFAGPWAYINDPLIIWRSGTHNSLGLHAEKDRSQLRECYRVLHEKILKNQRIDCRVVRWYLRHNLRRVRREILIEKLLCKGDICSRGEAKFLEYFNRFSDAALRRSPWYPQMKVVRIDCCRRRESDND